MHKKSSPIKTLTAKETEVLQLLKHGHLYKEIAELQGVKIDTVKKHTKNIYKKLNVRNRTEAANKLHKP
jgi:two-component system, NarL family, response regulator LiaR